MKTDGDNEQRSDEVRYRLIAFPRQLLESGERVMEKALAKYERGQVEPRPEKESK
jgi:hypothetical protein